MDEKSESPVLCEPAQTLKCTGFDPPPGVSCSDQARWPFVVVAGNQLVITVSFKIQSALGMQRRHGLFIEDREQNSRNDLRQQDALGFAELNVRRATRLRL